MFYSQKVTGYSGFVLVNEMLPNFISSDTVDKSVRKLGSLLSF